MEFFVKILKNTENACKILKNGKIYTERQESSLEALNQDVRPQLYSGTTIVLV